MQMQRHRQYGHTQATNPLLRLMNQTFPVLMILLRIDLILTRPFSKLLVFRDCNITSGRFATASQLRWKTLQIKMDSLLRKTPKKIGWRDCASSLEVNELHWVAG